MERIMSLMRCALNALFCQKPCAAVLWRDAVTRCLTVSAGACSMQVVIGVGYEAITSFGHCCLQRTAGVIEPVVLKQHSAV